MSDSSGSVPNPRRDGHSSLVLTSGQLSTVDFHPESTSPGAGDKPLDIGYTSPVMGDDPRVPGPGYTSPVIGDPVEPCGGRCGNPDCDLTVHGTLPIPGDLVCNAPSLQKYQQYVADGYDPATHDFTRESSPGVPILRQRFFKGHPIPDADHLPPGDPEGLTLVYCSVCRATCLIGEGNISTCHGAPLLDTFLRPYDVAAARELVDLSIRKRRERPKYSHVYFIKKTGKYRASFRRGNRGYFLGEYAQDFDAAKVADNALYYVSRAGYLPVPQALNFPDHYKGETVPGQWDATTRALVKLKAVAALEISLPTKKNRRLPRPQI